VYAQSKANDTAQEILDLIDRKKMSLHEAMAVIKKAKRLLKNNGKCKEG